jgi:hypothetical protein
MHQGKVMKLSYKRIQESKLSALTVSTAPTRGSEEKWSVQSFIKHVGRQQELEPEDLSLMDKTCPGDCGEVATTCIGFASFSQRMCDCFAMLLNMSDNACLSTHQSSITPPPECLSTSDTSPPTMCAAASLRCCGLVRRRPNSAVCVLCDVR